MTLPDSPALETALVIENRRGQALVGVFHPARAQSPPHASHEAASIDALDSPGLDSRGADAERLDPGVVLFLHGWSGTRSGPHQILTRAARALADRGLSSLRFDFAGRGDSQGDTDAATLASMREDAIDALNWLRARHPRAPIFALGVCSGCEVAFALAGHELGRRELAGLVLWSAPIFAAAPESSPRVARAGANWKRYARKLVSPASWRKVLSGRVDVSGVTKALAGEGGAAYRNRETGLPGQLPPGFRAHALAGWKEFEAPVLAVYGSADPIARDAIAWLNDASVRPPELHVIEGATHSFTSLEWEHQLIELSATRLLGWSRP